eukprot:1586795-Karenia_brevis.AAC.1
MTTTNTSNEHKQSECSSNNTDVESVVSDFDIKGQQDDTKTETLEPWVEWIKRATHQAEERARKLNVEDWVMVHRRMKWRWAARIAQQSSDRWPRM